MLMVELRADSTHARSRRERNGRVNVRSVWSIVLASLTWIVFATPAHAIGLGLGIQDDNSSPLSRAAQIDADWVRISVADNRWAYPDLRQGYIDAARTAKADGRNVMVSLLAWRSFPTPVQWKIYAQDVSAQLSAYVDAWSVMNEPNWFGMTPSTLPGERLGRAYRRIWDAVAPVLASDTNSIMVVGDLAPGRSDRQFMNDFYGRKPPSIKPRVLGIHPYGIRHGRGWNVGGVKDAKRFAKAHRLKLWATEWGIHSFEPTKAWISRLALLRKAGVSNVFIYDVNHQGWNTQMPTSILDKLAKRP